MYLIIVYYGNYLTFCNIRCSVIMVQFLHIDKNPFALRGSSSTSKSSLKDSFPVLPHVINSRCFDYRIKIEFGNLARLSLKSVKYKLYLVYKRAHNLLALLFFFPFLFINYYFSPTYS